MRDGTRSALLFSLFAMAIAGCPDTGDDDTTSEPSVPPLASPTPAEPSPGVTLTPTPSGAPTSTPQSTATPWPAGPTATPGSVSTPTLVPEPTATPVPPAPSPTPAPEPSPTPAPEPTPTPPVDADGDGYPASNDCNDLDPAVHPGALEVCNGQDDNCDGNTDEDVTITWYADEDGDGHGAGEAHTGCTAPEGSATEGDDCDDTLPSVFPGASEVCNGQDDNCDGNADEGLDITDFYLDEDGDGFGTGVPISDCKPVPGYAEDDEDCDDGDAAVNPAATEVCDMIDNDCDDLVDEEVTHTFYVDGDGDGYGTDSSAQACSAPEGYAERTGDCRDDDATVHPDAVEVCNDIDDDCDGNTDEGLDLVTSYPDGDGDGYGTEAGAMTDCLVPDGFVETPGDCDDGAAAVNPGAVEVCNGIDDDCDGDTDGDATDAPTWYLDGDGDGHGDATQPLAACDQPPDHVGSSDDCDDLNPTVHPGADEVCNGIDDDCDGTVDDDPADGTPWYVDQDQDGFGDPDGVVACEAPSPAHIQDGTDCDDADPRTFPGAQEICDSADNDCDGEVDEDCPSAILLPPPDYGFVAEPPDEGACALIGEVDNPPDPHYIDNLATYMSMLDGDTAGLVSAVPLDSPVLDWSIRYNGDPLASPGNYTDSTLPWPSMSPNGSYGSSRFRGYLNIRAGDPLNVTIGLIGNDSLRLIIQGQEIVWVNWSNGQWKKFRYLSFPSPGLYTFEVQWSTNFCCNIDPFELVWAEGFMPGYEDYDTMCASSSCIYNNGQPIPGFFIIGAPNLVQSTTGVVHGCLQCNTQEDCADDQVCNSAGLCESP